MALTRSYLKGMNLTEEQVSGIIEAHTETVNGLKDELKQAKADAEKLPKVQEELDRLKADAEKGAKYDKLKEEYDQYKADIEAKATKATKEAAYRALLKEIGVSEKRIDTVIRASSKEIEDLKLDKDGNIDGKADMTKSLKTEWSDFIGNTQEHGANTSTPPGGSGSGTKMTREEIYKKDDKGRYVLDATARQAALAELMNAEE